MTQDERAENIYNALVEMTWGLGQSRAELRQLTFQSPNLVKGLVLALSKTPLGNANPDWWRESPSRPGISDTTITLVVGKIIERV